MIKKTNLVLFISMSFLFFGCDYEEPEYKVLQSEEDFEIREYPSLIIAEIKMSANTKKLRNKSFIALFDYISGNNKEKQEIKMTVPVFQSQAEDEKWSMSFVLPQKWKLEEVPKPNNSTITIKQLSSQKMAVIRFSGRDTDINFSKHKKLLEAYLIKNEIEYNKTQPIYAIYNSPWTPWFLKRNEVLFVLLDNNSSQ
ncbi:MAG: heme-binding protein [Oligoflexia bacterium]|nr:heme-binding protein [Oligoflexia bacterium]